MRLNEKQALIIAVFTAGLCSIIYELLISTTSSYFLGDSVKQFSLTIGVYMAAMGVGSYLSKFIERDILRWFIWIELALGLVGGASVPILYGTFHLMRPGQFQILILSLTAFIGICTGFEVPLLARIMKKFYPLKANLANVLSLDYIGALGATLLFPFLLLPFIGLFRTSVGFGLLNIALGFFIYFYFRRAETKRQQWSVLFPAVFVVLGFVLLLLFSRQIQQHWESQYYTQNIIHAEQSPYQNIVLTQNKNDTRLYLNRVIQYSSKDEYRYHEALALLPAGAARRKVEQVLILGGGEGLLAREILQLPSIKKVKIVDLDERVFHLSENHPDLKALNKGALTDPRVEKIAVDAAVFLRFDEEKYDLILADLPDPSNEAVARLYSTYFFQLAKARLRKGGVFATQASSPFHTRKAFWCIVETLKTIGFLSVLPYHVYVPSFGDWGFVMASESILPSPQLPEGLSTKFLEKNRLQHFFEFAPDIQAVQGVKANTLDRPFLLDYYLADWKNFQREKTQ